MTGTAMVSGGTGCIATCVIHQLLEAGWTVQTTIRDLKREVDARSRFADADSRPAFFQADLMHDEGWAVSKAPIRRTSTVGECNR